MTKTYVSVLLAIFLCLGTSAGVAQKTSRISEMSYLVGNWSCSVTKGDKSYLGKKFSSVHSMVGKSVWFVGSTGDTSRIVFDAKRNRFIFIYSAPDGSYFTSESPGWVNGTMTWTFTYGPPGEVSGSWAMIKRNASAYDFTVTPAGAKAPVYAEACSR